jgi:tetratricopeptide (TPR) repeat protein
MRNKSFIHLVIIAALGIIVYSNTFDVPFQFDDIDLIEKNAIIRNLGYFLEPSEAEDLTYYSAFKHRYISYLTFALNYRLNGFDVIGYHLVNTGVHVLNAWFVYFLIILSFKTPFFARPDRNKRSVYIAFFSGLIFVSHPIQTEAVTYIFQRHASLVTLFYMASLLAYIKCRLSENRNVRHAFYALSLISAVLAMKTKENAFTLPIMIFLYEFLFFRGRGSIKGRVAKLVPFLLTMLIVPATIIGMERPIGEIIGGFVSANPVYDEVTRWNYLFTEFRVIVTYIRLLFLPVNQNIDYDYPLYDVFFNPAVLLSFVSLLFLFWAAIYFIYRSRFKARDINLIAFGILWFFITLSVESSIIPIPMLIDEYRVYLPSVGAVVAVAAGMGLLTANIRSRKIATAAVTCFILMTLLIAAAAFTRNSAWDSTISLWEDTIRKSPLKARPRNNLGLAYFNEGRFDDAIKQYAVALQYEPDAFRVHNNIGSAYLVQGHIDKAIEHYEQAVRLRPFHVEAISNLGLAYFRKGDMDEAIEYYEFALRLNPNADRIHVNLGLAYVKEGRLEKAEEEFRTALRLNPGSKQARKNLDSIIRIRRGG